MSILSDRLRQVSVIGDAEASAEAMALGEQLGRKIAENGYALITGGRGGIMEAASRGAHNAGGITIGIVPSESLSEANKYCQIVIPTGLGHARNVLTALAGDAIVAIGGAAGTLSEICFSWIHKKPIFVFTQFGGWSDMLAGKCVDNRRERPIVACHSPDEIILNLDRLFKD